MAKSERLIRNIKNNFGTYAKINENLSQMGGDEFVYITDRVIPLAPTTDGDYVLNVENNEATWKTDTALQPNDNVSELTNDAGYITGITSSDVTTALGYTPYNSTNPNGYITKSVNDLTNYTLTSALSTVATSGSYTDLSNQPTIPTVNNKTITITQGGVTKGSFTLNQSTNETIALDSGGSIVATDDVTIHENSDNKLEVIGIKDLTATVTELNYTDGVTSNIQTQLNNKTNDLMYDASYFKVTGSPTITEDGVVSGFSNNDYISFLPPDVTKTDWSFTIKFKFVYQSQNFIVGNPEGGNFSRLAIIALGRNLFYFLGSGASNSWDISSGVYGSTALTDNNEYSLTFSRVSGTSYVSTLKNLTTNVETTDRTFTTTSALGNNKSLNMKLGAGGWEPNIGEIDLKGFSLSENNVVIKKGINKVHNVVNNKLDPDLTQLSTVGNKVIDGQWVSASYVVLNSTISSGTKYTYDLSSILTENCQYTVLVYGRTKSSVNVNVDIQSDITDPVMFLYRESVTASYAGTTANCVILPISTSKKVYLTSWSRNSDLQVKIVAFRRIGLNA